jgi:hypothetical protein
MEKIMPAHKKVRQTASYYRTWLQQLPPDDLKYVEITTEVLCKVYRVSWTTLRNYRRGYYHSMMGYMKWFTDEHDTLQHNEQAKGGALTYKISWVNEFLRLTGQDDKIPSFLRKI